MLIRAQSGRFSAPRLVTRGYFSYPSLDASPELAHKLADANCRAMCAPKNGSPRLGSL